MNNNNRNWVPIINAVQGPLSFFALSALILDAIFLDISALTDRISLWAPFIVFVILLLFVFIITMTKPRALYNPRDLPSEKFVTIKVLFPDHLKPIDVDIDGDKCQLLIRDKHSRPKSERNLSLLLGSGGWYFRLLEEVENSDSVRLEIVERNGRRWEVKPFDPYETVVQAYPFSTSHNRSFAATFVSA
jgi:hypothetical protein